METVLVGFEQTESAARALRRAAELAEAFHARLIVVSVTEPALLAVAEPALGPVPPLVAAPASASLSADVAGASQLPGPEESSHRLLERARSYLVQRALEAEYVAEVGDPAERLLALAEERNADLIVVGHREHGFLERLLGRPVDQAVARQAEYDVLLVH
jgi:nucleotide-binding universal stress UspA family protein